MEKPELTIVPVFETKFIKIFDLQHDGGRHYYDATRRSMNDLVAVKSDEEVKTMLPDAVSCVVIINNDGETPKLLLTHEFRYPAGQFLLSVPAGLIDPQDKAKENPLFETAIREMKEETGLDITENDRLSVINPFVYSTPGMTDESNALVCVEFRNVDLKNLSQDGCEGAEKFDGFLLVDEQKARELLKTGRDEKNDFYSVYTWAALMYFISGLWK